MRLGFTPIDEDHAQLLSLVAEVEVLIATEDAAARIQAKFAELVTHSLDHFRLEEFYMEACHYPHLAVHKQEHKELAAWLSHLARLLAEHGPSATVAANDHTLAFFRAWVDRHLKALDEPAVLYLLAHESELPKVDSLSSHTRNRPSGTPALRF